MTAPTHTAHPAAPRDVPTMIGHYIDGEVVPSVSGRTFPNVDPVTNTPYVEVAAGNRGDAQGGNRDGSHHSR